MNKALSNALNHLDMAFKKALHNFKKALNKLEHTVNQGLRDPSKAFKKALN